MEETIGYDKIRDMNSQTRTLDPCEQTKWFCSDIEKTLALSAFDDVSLGRKEWTNIQPILRTAIKSLHEASTAQWQWMQTWEHRLNKKADKEDLDLRLATKVAEGSYVAEMRRLKEEIDEKADNRYLQEVRNEIVTQSNFYEFTKKISRQILEVEKDLSRKPNAHDVQRANDKLNEDLEKVVKSSKKTSEEVWRCHDKLDVLQREVESGLAKLQRNDELLNEMKSSVKQSLSQSQIEAKLNSKAEAVS